MWKRLNNWTKYVTTLYAPKLGCDMHSPVIEDQSSLKRETLCKIVLKSEFRGKEGLKSVIKANILISSQLQSLRKRHNRWEKNPKQEKLRLNCDARDWIVFNCVDIQVFDIKKQTRKEIGNGTNKQKQTNTEGCKIRNGKRALCCLQAFWLCSCHLFWVNLASWRWWYTSSPNWQARAQQFANLQWSLNVVIMRMRIVGKNKSS